VRVAGWWVCTENGEALATRPGVTWAWVAPRGNGAGELVVKHCTGESEGSVPLEVVEALLSAHKSAVSKPSPVTPKKRGGS
jgi:hypothetical protein